MSDQDKIHGIITELNNKKNEIVKNMSLFIKESKELVQKTTKEQEKAEDMLKIIRGIEKYHSITIPDIKNSSSNPTTPGVKIHYPTNGLKFEFGKDIKLEFETTHIKTPFMYYIVGKEKTSPNQFPIKAFRSINAKVLLNSIKENNKNPLPVGTYIIAVNIVEKPSKKSQVKLIAADQITIEVTSAGTPTALNSIKITSPINANSPYTNEPIPVTFSVAGPYHDTGKDYGYIMVVTDSNKKEVVPKKYGTTKNKDVSHNDYLINLPDGEYTIQIGIFDPIASVMISTAKETFIVQLGQNPQPILNKITIVSPVAVNSPYKSPVAIQFSVEGPHHDAGKDYVYIAIVTDANNKKVFNDRGMAKTKNIAHAKALDKLADGQYILQITIGDPATKKILSTAKETFVISSSPNSTQPKKKRGTAAYSLVVGNDVYVGGGNFSAEITKDKPISIELQNSGAGGKLVWDSGKEDWLKITPNKGALEAEQSQKIVISLDYEKYLKAGSPGIGLAGFEGYKGNKLPKISVVDIKKYVKNKVLGLSWIIVNVK